MPYAEVKRAIEQEAQVQNTATRSASPYRLSPREVNKASPQPDMNAARYSVPPGKDFIMDLTESCWYPWHYSHTVIASYYSLNVL